MSRSSKEPEAAMSHRSSILTLLVGLALALVVPSLGAAQECAPTDTTDRFRLLRQLSIDLRGRIPSEAEYEAVRGLTDVSPELITAMITSDDFFGVMRDYHRGLLWDTLDQVKFLVDPALTLTQRRVWGPDTELILYSKRPGQIDEAANWRGSFDVTCADIEQTEFVGGGPGPREPVPVAERWNGTANIRGAAHLPDDQIGDQGHKCAGRANGCRIDGWVRIRPYWDMTSEVRVCAYDAYTCGANLRNCLAPGARDVIQASLENEPLQIFEAAMRSPTASYFTALTTRETQIDGPLSHYYRLASRNVMLDQTIRNNVPTRNFDDRTWVGFQRSAQHAGILTTLAFHLRLGSYRGRANRFATAFQCAPFDGGGSLGGGTPNNPNLSARTPCNGCHQRLEPLAMPFGRWRINGEYGFLTQGAFPATDMTCATCMRRDPDGPVDQPGTCSDRCNDYYLTDQNRVRNAAGRPYASENQWLGKLLVREWYDDAPLDAGPESLVDPAVLGSCTARNVASRFLHREVSANEAEPWTDVFRTSGYRMQDLVRAIVSSETYRATR